MKLRKMLISGIMAMGVVAAPLAFATSASASINVQNYASGGPQGGSSGKLVDYGTYKDWDPQYVGQVTSNTVTNWPFTYGTGLNSTYAGDNVYWMQEHGASGNWCWQMSGASVVLSSSCGTGHVYSLWVQTRAPNGNGWNGLVNVGSSDDAGYGGDMKPPDPR